LADDEAKHGTEKCPEEITEKQNKAQGEETEIRAKAVASSEQQPNWIVRFGELDHPVSPGSVQKGVLKTIAPRTASSACWCPLGITPSQRRRIQRLRAQKIREEADEKERRVVERYPADDPDEARMEGEEEDQRPCTHGL
jgi:hypothetical protein